MPGAQYVIDIAARMPAGEQTAAQLDEITRGLADSGKGAEHFQQAIVQASASLDAARATTTRVSAALAEAQAQYKQLQRSAIEASKAAEKEARKGAVSEETAKRAHDANAAVNAYVHTLESLEKVSAAAAKEERHLAQSFGNVKKLSSHVDKSLAGQSEALGKLAGGLGAVGGPLGGLGQRLVNPIKGFSELSQTMGAGNAQALLLAAGAAAAAAAIALVTVAVVAGVAAITAWAVKLADASRAQKLTQEAAEALNPALVEQRGTFAALSKETGIATSELNGLHENLTAAGVAAGDMAPALRAAALAEAALGKGGSAKFIAQIKEGKQSVSELAAETQTKLGGIVARQMLGLDATSNRLKKSIGETFGGLDIEPLLRGLSRLVDLFDQNTAAGQAMKTLFEAVFQPLINNAEKAALVIEAFAIGFLIGLTKVYIAIKPTIKAISELFGFDDTALVDLLTSAKGAGEIVAYVFTGLAVAAGAVLAAFAAAAANVVGFIAAIIGLPAAIAAAVAAVFEFTAALTVKLVRAVVDIPWGQIGGDMMRGLASGITGAAGVVVDAVKSAVGNAVKSAKSALGIASPSKVFASLGEYTGEGYAEGGGGSSASVNLAGATFIFNGVQGAEDSERRFEELLTRAIEGDAAKLGAMGAP